MRITPARWLNWIMLLLMVWTVLNLGHYRKEGRVILFDVVQYYSYLPAVFIEGDPSLKFIGEDRERHRGHYIPNHTEEGHLVIKMTAGVAYLYAPFFFIGHGLAHATGEVTDGFSWPYKLAIVLGAILYLSLALRWLRKMLEKRFSMLTTCLTLVAVVLGTNLYYYATVEAAMSHVFSFFLIVGFIYLLEKWLTDGSWKKALLLGATLGLIALVRPTNALIVVLIPLWGVSNRDDLKTRFTFLWLQKLWVLPMMLCAALVWVPQFWYYHAVTGRWWAWAYVGESFHFDRPHVIAGLFSFHKGWLVYTPMMLFALIGLWFSRRQKEGWNWAILVWLIPFTYVTFSWWCWWYGGSFGQRPFIEFYGLLAFPLAAFFSWLLKSKKVLRYALFPVLGFVLALNLFQTRQYYGGVALHWDSMTWEAYQASFFRIDPPSDFKEKLLRPDYDLARETGELKYVPVPD